MTRFNKGQQVTYKSKAGRRFKAVVYDPHIVHGKIKLVVAGDPFAVPVAVSQVKSLFVSEKTTKQAEWRQRNPEKVSAINRRGDLKKNHGLTEEQYDAMLESQQGVCAICGRPERAKLNGKLKRLCVDHNHETGEIRGLLCINCNRAVGNVSDDPDTALAVQRYLQGMIPVRTDVWGGDSPVEAAVRQIDDCKSLPEDVTVKIVTPLKGEPMAVATTAKSGRRLAKEAKMLGIKGFAKMSGPDLKAAVEAAKNGNGSKPRSTPAKVASKPTKAVARKPVAKKVASRPAKAAVSKKKAPVRKVVAKKVAPVRKSTATGDNPFREGSNSFIMAAELIKGGNRGQMVKRLLKAMKIHPWSKPKEEDPEFAIRKRMLLVAAALEKDHGFTIEREGRGEAGSIVAIPPGRKSSGQAAKKKGTKKSAASRKR